MGALTVPGVGPIIATGWFLSGALTGALAGGVLGALVDAGVPEKDAERHASDHARGRSFVSVRVEEPDVALATRILEAAMPLELADDFPQQDLIKVVS